MGKRSLHGNKIIICGLSEQEEKKIKKHIYKDNIEVYAANDVTDVVAYDCSMIILNAVSLSVDETEMVYSYYNEIGTFAETVIILGQVSEESTHPKIMYFNSFVELESNLEYLIMDAFGKKQKAESFSRSLSYALAILKMITENPGITTKYISEKLEISPRSVTRYIETLNVAGECIVYNHKSRGWSLGYDESLLKLGV